MSNKITVAKLAKLISDFDYENNEVLTSGETMCLNTTTDGVRQQIRVTVEVTNV